MKKRFQKSKIYGIFLRGEDGTLMGYVEHSFHMNWEKTFVRAWRSAVDAQRILEGLMKDDYKKSKFDLSVTPKKKEIFVARLGSDNSPVSIKEWKPRTGKFNWRNAPFTVIQ